jgi:hypothetical protein
MPVEDMATTEHRNELREFRRKVGSSLDALKMLGGYMNRASIEINASSAGRKKPKDLGRQLKLDPDAFDRMGMTVPTTEGEVRVVCGEILLRLKGILGVRVYPYFHLPQSIHGVSGLPVRSKTTRGIRCVQAPTQRIRDHNSVLRIHSSADQGHTVLQKRRRFWRVADPVTDGGARVPTRSQT